MHASFYCYCVTKKIICRLRIGKFNSSDSRVCMLLEIVSKMERTIECLLVYVILAGIDYGSVAVGRHCWEFGGCGHAPCVFLPGDGD